MSRKSWFLSPVILLCLSVYCQAQLWSGVLDPTRAMDWSTAGVNGGIRTRTTICSTLNPGATAAQINSAIASCPSGQVVKLNAGTYNLSTGLIFDGKSNVTLRGAGADQTFLVFNGVNGCGGYQASICFMGNGNWYGGTPAASTNWTAGYAKGTTQITVASASGFSVGQVIVLDQLDDTTDAGEVIVCDTTGGPECSREGGSPGRANRAQEQYVRLTAINGNVFTISPGLHMPNWRSSQSPQVFLFGAQSELDGVEDLSINHLNAGGQGGIVFHNAYNSWVKGVRSTEGPRNHIWLLQAAQIEIRDSYFWGTQGTHSQSYGIESFLASDCLVTNNIFQNVTIPMMIGNNSGSVYSYNFSIDDTFDVASWMQPAQVVHDAGVDTLLLEGNVGAGLQADLFHGTSNFVTAFRNYYNGWETGKSSNTLPVQLQAKHRFYNLVGNVLGRTSYHSHYEDLAPSGTNGNTSIYVLGWSGQVGSTDDTGIPNDTLVAATVMRWGNYDTFNAASRFVASEVPSGLIKYANAVPANNNLPSSFYLSGQPNWWPAAKPWPPIGPDVTGGNIAGLGGHAYTIPAQDCYSNVMGGPADGSGNALNFNADSCYGTNGPPPPDGLTAIVH